MTREEKARKIADLKNEIGQLQSDLELEIHLDKATIDAIHKKIRDKEEQIERLES